MTENKTTIHPCSYNPADDLVLVEYDESREKYEAYLEVKYREHWFHSYCAENGIEGYIDAGSLDIQPVTDPKFPGFVAQSKAIVYMDGKVKGEVTAAGFVPLGVTEKFQTVVTTAIGRALNIAGFGTVAAGDTLLGKPFPVDSGVKLTRDPDDPGSFIRRRAPEKPAPKPEKTDENPLLSAMEEVSKTEPETKEKSAPEKPAPKPAAGRQPLPDEAETLEHAYVMICPYSKHKGKTISAIMATDPEYIKYFATKEFDDSKLDSYLREQSRRWKSACSMVYEAAIA